MTATLFTVLWIVAQPALFPRFVLYLFPLTLLLAFDIVCNISLRRSRVLTVGVVAACALLAGADVLYARDNLRFAASGDAATFHRYTWYYPVYDWINLHTARDARFAVIVWSGYSYHLDREYRRADPWLSGEIDWLKVSDANALDKVLDQLKIDYVVYENRDWRGFRGGAEMMRAFSEAQANGSLVPVRKFHQRLYTSRLNESYVESDVYILARR